MFETRDPRYQFDIPLPSPQTSIPGYAEKADTAQCNSQVADVNCLVDQIFTFHPATPSTGPKFETIREAAKYFAKVLVNNVPAGADRTAAIRKLREAVMTANTGISLGGLSL